MVMNSPSIGSLECLVLEEQFWVRTLAGKPEWTQPPLLALRFGS